MGSPHPSELVTRPTQDKLKNTTCADVRVTLIGVGCQQNFGSRNNSGLTTRRIPSEKAHSGTAELKVCLSYQHGRKENLDNHYLQEKPHGAKQEHHALARLRSTLDFRVFQVGMQKMRPLLEWLIELAHKVLAISARRESLTSDDALHIHQSNGTQALNPASSSLQVVAHCEYSLARVPNRWQYLENLLSLQALLASVSNHPHHTTQGRRCKEADLHTALGHSSYGRVWQDHNFHHHVHQNRYTTKLAPA